MTDRLQFWKRHFRTLSDEDLCAVHTRDLKKTERLGLLEALYERLPDNCNSDSLFLLRRFQRLNCLRAAFCADCNSKMSHVREYYMVKDHVWEQAWANCYRSPTGDGQLCIGCLERRIGRALTRHDFTDVPANNPDDYMSDRLRSRLTTDPVPASIKGGADGLIAFLVERALQKLPEHERAKKRAAWAASEGKP